MHTHTLKKDASGVCFPPIITPSLDKTMKCPNKIIMPRGATAVPNVLERRKVCYKATSAVPVWIKISALRNLELSSALGRESDCLIWFNSLNLLSCKMSDLVIEDERNSLDQDLRSLFYISSCLIGRWLASKTTGLLVNI